MCISDSSWYMFEISNLILSFIIFIFLPTSGSCASVMHTDQAYYLLFLRNPSLKKSILQIYILLVRFLYWGTFLKLYT